MNSLRGGIPQKSPLIFCLRRSSDHGTVKVVVVGGGGVGVVGTIFQFDFQFGFFFPR